MIPETNVVKYVFNSQKTCSRGIYKNGVTGVWFSV